MARFIKQESGFGLIELTVVIIVVGILVAVAMQSMTAVVDDARKLRTEREMEMLADAIVGNPEIGSGGQRSDFGYVGDVGAFPPDLQALYQNPGSYVTWNGPYIPPGFTQDSTGFKTDEWGTPYNYSGGLAIVSTGSGSTISKKIADASSDYLLNALNGMVTDGNDSLPGPTYDDSVDIEITVPDGSGSLVSKTYQPDSTGAFRLDSLPVGMHPLRIIYVPEVDTMFCYITILPRHRSDTSEVYKFAAAHFDFATGGCAGSGSDTLRPEGPGATTVLATNGCTSNWECVDEVTPDDDNTYVKSSGTSYGTDTYQTTDPSDTSCTITSVTVYFRARMFVKTAYAKAVLRTHGADYEGTEKTLTGGFAEYGEQWTTNPNTGSAWTWSEIEDMEIGVSLRSSKSTHPCRCTQVWVKVEYSD